MARALPRKTCTSHCRACGQCFHSVAAFDLHFAGTYWPENTRHCVPASEVAGLTVWGEGTCDLGVSQTPVPATIWNQVGSEAVRARFLASARAEKAADGAASVPGRPAPERGV